MSANEQQVNELVRQIVEAVHPLRILLFGSAARGEAGPESDLDVLVVMPEGTHRRHTAQYLYRSIRGVTTPFDVLVATPDDLERHRNNPWLIYRDVLKEGRTLYAAAA